VGTGESGPFLALEQVAVTRASTREGLTRALSLYNLTGYVASAARRRAGDAPHRLTHLGLRIFLAGAVIQLGAYALMRRSPPCRRRRGRDSERRHARSSAGSPRSSRWTPSPAAS
jgi:hypothetical protein